METSLLYQQLDKFKNKNIGQLTYIISLGLERENIQYRYQLNDELEKMLMLNFRTDLTKIDLSRIECLFNIFNKYLDEEIESKIKSINDEFIKHAERVFLNLPFEKIEPFADKYIILNLKTTEVIGVFKTRLEAHQFIIDNKLDPKKYYLRKVKLTPLFV